MGSTPVGCGRGDGVWGGRGESGRASLDAYVNPGGLSRPGGPESWTVGRVGDFLLDGRGYDYADGVRPGAWLRLCALRIGGRRILVGCIQRVFSKGKMAEYPLNFRTHLVWCCASDEEIYILK